MESLVTDSVQFLCTTAKFSWFRIEQWAMPALNFEIFLKFPHFLRSKVLSHLAARDATRIFKFW